MNVGEIEQHYRRSLREVLRFAARVRRGLAAHLLRNEANGDLLCITPEDTEDAPGFPVGYEIVISAHVDAISDAAPARAAAGGS